MLLDDVRRLLTPLLTQRLSARQRCAIAAALRELASEQERLADAETRIGHVVRQQRPDPDRPRGGRPRGSGATTLTWDSTGGGKAGTSRTRRSGHLLIGRGLDVPLGSPARLDIQRSGGQLVLRPCGTGVGYAVTRSGNGMPRCSIGQAAAETLGLADGVYQAELHDGAIVARL